MTITNLDPKPWWSPKYDLRFPSENRAPGMPTYWNPRREFDMLGNPILLALLDEPSWDDDDEILPMPVRVRDQLNTLTHEPFMFNATPDQISHARTVLEAIVRGS